ncbi:hypothetical protein [Enterobacter roggenkampii]|uniref:hypothetical protein n=1 Tax=Enterobacter roggenkampii TaxID=1812935 RepID=UPI0013CFA1FF|nr:hypothetical protein [Enterobacter roggenkampii]MDL0006139.1 hypothetical protein [Enterobacter roggenkampii]MED5758169.1 hypothetical protein [Enterobacter roggenkampii]NHA24784.1 hypothetical protein [Enterobacter roggenkampii]HDR2469787.1 hypothetical protein [Enterobacter roggenkampii]
MSDSRILASIFRELQDAVLELSKSDIEKVIVGDYQFSIKIVKKKSSAVNRSTMKEDKNTGYEYLLGLLSQCASREDGISVLERELKNKADYERFARQVEVAVMKSDKLEKIRDNIIESTVGARLRSDAIQNKG